MKHQIKAQLVFVLSTYLVVSSEAAGVPTAAQWTALNQTVGGRLFRGVPLAQPCYSNYNGTTEEPDTASCGAIQDGYTNDTYIRDYYGGFMNTNWATCQSNAKGCLLNYNSPTSALTAGAECYQGSVSPYYVEVQKVSDIQAALNFAQETGIDVSIKNTGHDYKGRSVAPNSLAIWTHNIQPEIKLERDFIPDGCSAPVGDGVTFGAGQGFAGLYQFADENNVTIVGGASGTVGVAGGWITGGGHSALSNTLGLGVDNVLQLRGVLPNGTYVTANECQNPDLWFAWRGGGGSTFGVNFEMTTRANPHVTLQVAYASFGSYDAQSLEKFLSICIENGNKWASEGWGGYILPGDYTAQSSGFILLTPVLSYEEAVTSMAPLTDYVESFGNVVYSNTVETIDGFYEVSKLFSESVGLGTAIGSRLIPSSQFDGATNQEALLAALLNISAEVTYPTRPADPEESAFLTYGDPVQFLVTAPSSYSTTAANDTSSITPAWRDAVWHVLVNVPFSNEATAAQISQAFQDAHVATDVLRALVPNSGAYQNEADVFEIDPAATFWGEAHYERLVAIKKELDPDNILTCWDCIGWNSEDERYACYPSIS